MVKISYFAIFAKIHDLNTLLRTVLWPSKGTA